MGGEARMVSQEPGSPCPALLSAPCGCGQSCRKTCSSGRNGNEDVFPTLQVGLKLCLEPDHLGLDLTCYVIY